MTDARLGPAVLVLSDRENDSLWPAGLTAFDTSGEESWNDVFDSKKHAVSWAAAYMNGVYDATGVVLRAVGFHHDPS